MLKKSFFFFFLVWGFSEVSMQGQGRHLSKKHKKLFQKAEIFIGQSKYVQAESLLNEIIAHNPKNIRSYLVLANMFSTMKIYALSINQYRKAMKIDTDRQNFYYLPISICFSGLGKFDTALHYLRIYNQKMNPLFIKREKIETLEKNFLFAIDYEKRYKKHLANYNFKVYNMGDSLNTPLSEYFPSLNFENTKIIFTRRIKGVSGKSARFVKTKEKLRDFLIRKRAMTNIENEDFFRSMLVNGKWTKAQPLDGDLNSPLNEGGSNLSLNGKKLYFTGCNLEDSKGSCDIYVSEFKDGKWSKSRNLSNPINSEFWESQPSISSDSKTLYFASRRPGGFGGSDLYVSYKNKRGKWSDPENLGPRFNTPGDEVAPFIHSDNRTIFFASNTLPGYGGLDLFTARRIGKNKWTIPKNLGYPINSIENESNIIISSNGETALFSSDKGDSRGKIDLFQFQLRKDLRPQTTFLHRKKLVTNKKIPLQSVRLRIYDIQDSLLVANPEIDTSGVFEMSIAKDRYYLIDINGKSIFYKYDTLDTHKNIESLILDSVMEVDPIIVGAKISINHIYFGIDSFTLRPSSFFELNRLVDMLKLNPDVKILISGYTDNIGGETYNLNLSEKRALSVYRYLIKHNIEPRRLSWKGLGKQNPIRENKTEKDRSLNRRIEIEILSKS